MHKNLFLLCILWCFVLALDLCITRHIPFIISAGHCQFLSCKSIPKHFYCFLKMLRVYPHHPTHKLSRWIGWCLPSSKHSFHDPLRSFHCCIWFITLIPLPAVKMKAITNRMLPLVTKQYAFSVMVKFLSPLLQTHGHEHSFRIGVQLLEMKFELNWGDSDWLPFSLYMRPSSSKIWQEISQDFSQVSWLSLIHIWRCRRRLRCRSRWSPYH